jgi:hypothetical protein
MFNKFFRKFNPSDASSEINLSNFDFKSSTHSRYENGKKTGTVDDCWRLIHISENKNIKSTYLVTIYILDDSMSHWGDKVQMATKQMKIIYSNTTEIILRGFGADPTGASFQDYGITLRLENNSVTQVALLMHDRNIELHYSR